MLAWAFCARMAGVGGDSGWRSAHRYCRDRRAYGRSVRQLRDGAGCPRAALSVSHGGFGLCGPSHCCHRQPGSVPMCSVADSATTWTTSSRSTPSAILQNCSGTTQIRARRPAAHRRIWQVFCATRESCATAFLSGSSGGIALAFVSYLKQMMKQAGVKARFVRGGSTKHLVELLEEGLTDYTPDGQTFDLEGALMAANLRRGDFPFTPTTITAKGILRRWSMQSCRSHRSRRKLQHQRGHAFRRTTAPRHRRLAELPCGEMHNPGGAFIPRSHSGHCG